MNLSELSNGDRAIITKVRGRGAFRKRITEMGFVKGKEIKVVKNAPLKDPIEYNIMGYDISLRKSEASLIEVVTDKEALLITNKEFNGVINDDILKTSAKEKSKIINIALVGNPNSGKTTLFNYASGSREHVGNYGGVTVDTKQARFRHKSYTFKINDLPGTYSISAYTPEELYVRNFIFNEVPDIVINVVDSSNLERNLYLSCQLIDMDIKVVIALNMFDELQKKGAKFDYQSLGKMVGIPMIPTISSKGKGIHELFDKIIDVYEDKDETVRHIHINYGKGVEKSIRHIQNSIQIPINYELTDKISSRFLSIKLLEKDKDILNLIKKQAKNSSEILATVNAEINKLESHIKDDSETIVTDAKYGFISGALKETYKEGVIDRRKKTEIIDTFITHKLFGFPIFIFLIWLMFQTTFSLGQYPMNWIDQIVSFSGEIIGKYMPPGTLKDLIIDGIIGGVGGVIVFLPNILILFFFISLMEDSGYMARAAFIMDKIMHKIGLHGKSFIPLIMGFGCNVPAIMSTRTLENRNDRLLTMLINPFMSCSARLPVYILLIGAFFKNNQGTVLFLIYLIGILIAIIMAIIFKKTIFKSKEVPFVMELPPYRIPTIRTTLIHMWNKGAQYLKKMGGVILVASVIIWAMGYYPQKIEYSKNYEQLIKEAEQYNNVNKKSIIEDINKQKLSEKQSKSYIGRLGKFIEPVIRPLGFDWKMGVSLITGIAAKEIVVSTMGVLYQIDPNVKNGSENLKLKLKTQKFTSGPKKGKYVFSKLTAFSFILFILIYFPCIAVIAAIKKESDSWKWAAFMVFYTTSLAWIISFLFYQIGSLFI
ncbi:MAG: ferrous iron transport protein B [Chlorobi bacterium]|nr:ferrous iron transport protein B [Chlorobiota bacterium]